MVRRDIDEAANDDGATRLQVFLESHHADGQGAWRHRGALALFLLDRFLAFACFLTSRSKTIPVKITTFPNVYRV